MAERTNGKTKIKCKWKFIAPGDRRRFRTFKYFINFLLASVLCGSQERYRMKARRVSEKKWLEEDGRRIAKWNGRSRGFLSIFFFQGERAYRYRNVIKTSKWLWIASRVTSLTSAFFYPFRHFFPLLKRKVPEMYFTDFLNSIICSSTTLIFKRVNMNFLTFFYTESFKSD